MAYPFQSQDVGKLILVAFWGVPQAFRRGGQSLPVYKAVRFVDALAPQAGQIMPKRLWA
jgi:hypothetical protein